MPNVNWMNLDAVIAYAKTLGSGMAVIKHPGRANYNITHAGRALRADVKVLYTT